MIAPVPFHQLIEKLDDGIATLSSEHNILYCNQHFAELLSLPVEKVQGQRLESFVAPEDAPRLHSLLDMARAGNRGTLRLTMDRANHRSLDLALYPLADSDPHAVCVLAANAGQQRQTDDDSRIDVQSLEAAQALIQRQSEDHALELESIQRQLATEISGRALAEQVVSESERRFRMLADSAPVMIYLADTQKQAYYFSKGWLDFRGTSEAEETGVGWTQGIHPDDRARVFRNYEIAFDHREHYRLEYRLLRHDGVYRWLIDDGSPRYLDDGAFIGYVGTCVDISERIESETKLRDARDELERRVEERTRDLRLANEETRRFASIVSHDLRAPLVNIRGFTGELASAFNSLRALVESMHTYLSDSQRAKFEALVNEDVPEALDFITSSVDRLHRYTTAILELSTPPSRATVSKP